MACSRPTRMANEMKWTASPSIFFFLASILYLILSSFTIWSDPFSRGHLRHSERTNERWHIMNFVHQANATFEERLENDLCFLFATISNKGIMWHDQDKTPINRINDNLYFVQSSLTISSRRNGESHPSMSFLASLISIKYWILSV